MLAFGSIIQGQNGASLVWGRTGLLWAVKGNQDEAILGGSLIL